ncbi:MAG TPA: hypothetical protein VMU33_01850 [Burkholderiaceae bacterium]|nr:hypothetical protein [Burkholderiaceae bacterium]
MMARSKWLLALGVAGLAACAAPLDSATIADAELALTCNNEAQCTRYWQRAQAWLAQNVPARLTTATDTVLETDGGGDKAWRIVRERTDGGLSRIRVYPTCEQGCSNDKVRVIADLKRYIAGR